MMPYRGTILAAETLNVFILGIYKHKQPVNGEIHSIISKPLLICGYHGLTIVTMFFL